MKPEKVETLEVIGLNNVAPPLYSAVNPYWKRKAALRGLVGKI